MFTIDHNTIRTFYSTKKIFFTKLRYISANLTIIIFSSSQNVHHPSAIIRRRNFRNRNRCGQSFGYDQNHAGRFGNRRRQRDHRYNVFSLKFFENYRQLIQLQYYYKVPIPNVTADILRKVLVYAEHHKNDPVKYDDEEESKCKRTDNISEWDAEFCGSDHETLFQLVLAANYLDLKGLLELICKTLANMLKNKTADEIRKTFDLTNDLTPAEEEQIRRENEWIGEY